MANTNFKGFMRNGDYPEYLERTKANVQVSIELTSVCNFHCYYCQYPHLKRNKGLSFVCKTGNRIIGGYYVVMMAEEVLYTIW